MEKEVRSNSDGQLVIEGVPTDKELKAKALKVEQEDLENNLKKYSKVDDSSFLRTLNLFFESLDFLLDGNDGVGSVAIKFDPEKRKVKVKYKKVLAYGEEKTYQKTFE